LSTGVEIIGKKKAGIDPLVFQHSKTMIRHTPRYSLPAVHRMNAGMI
jgi:hypothetical protein